MNTWAELYQLASDHAEQDRWDETAQLLEAVCRMVPEHASAHHLLGKARSKQGRLKEAETHQHRSCSLDPELGWNWFALAEVLAEQKQHEQAAELFQRASETLPDQPWIRELVAEQQLRALTGGQPLSAGLSAQAYATWCAELEPRLPPASQRLHQPWWQEPRQLPQHGWIVLRHPEAQLRPGALQALESWLLECAWADLPDALYCDEDRITAAGERHDPWFKPGWSWETFWAMPWLESFSAWRVSWLREQQLPLPPQDLEQRRQWIWQAVKAAPRMGHIAQVLVHRSDPRRRANEDEARALREHLQARGEHGVQVQPLANPAGSFQLQWPLPRGLRCRIVIPTRNQAGLLSRCLSSVEASTRGALTTEFVVVDNGSDEADLQALLAAWRERLGDRFRVLRVDAPFNWSDLSNQGARHPAAGQGSPADLLLFLNNDIEATQAGWLEAMASQAVRQPIGCVGALLCYPNQQLQHAGVVIGMHGGADHAYRHLPLDHNVHRGRSRLLSNWGAVTGACLMVRRALFEQLGGFDPGLPVEFNDVDFCLRLGQLGYRHVIPPEAVLIHHESQSRDARASSTAEAALQLMRQRWGQRLLHTAPWWPDAACPNSPDGRPKEWGSG